MGGRILRRQRRSRDCNAFEEEEEEDRQGCGMMLSWRMEESGRCQGFGSLRSSGGFGSG